MKSSLYQILSLSCVLALFGDGVYAYNDSNSSGYESDYENVKANDREYDGYGTSYNGEKVNPSGGEYYPFTKSTNRINEEEVIGVAISGSKVRLIGPNKQYSEEQGINVSEFKFLKNYPKLFSVDLRNIKLTTEKIDNLRRYLPKTITSLSINSCYVEKGDFEKFADIFVQRKQLQYVSVVMPYSAEAESAKLIAAIGDLETIKELSLVLGELESRGCSSLKETLEKSSKTLTRLSLGFAKVANSNSYDKLLSSIAQLKKLNALEYSVLQSTEVQVKNFFKSLFDLKNLTDLRFCFDDFNSHDGVKAYDNAVLLNKALGNLRNLKSLNISNMNLPDSVLQTISESVGNLPKLKTLNISGNPVNSKTAEKLNAALKKLETLDTLAVDNCKINGQAFSVLFGGVQSSSLKQLFLRFNEIKNSIASFPISQMSNLIALDVAYNGIGLNDIVSFMQKIPTETRLGIISWEGNGLDGFSEDQIVKEKKRIKKRDDLKIWKRDHGVNTLDLGI